VGLFAAGTPAYFDLLQTPCVANPCAYFQLPAASAVALTGAGISVRGYALFLTSITVATALAMAFVAMITFWWQSHEWISSYLSFGILALGPTFFSVLTEALVRQQPGWRVPAGIVQGLGVCVLLTWGYIFPDGRSVPRWARLLVLLAAAQAAALAALSSVNEILQSQTVAQRLLLFSIVATFAGGSAAQVYRYRRVSTPTARQQAKWVVFGLSLFAATAATFALSRALVPVLDVPGLPNALYFLVGGTLNVIGVLALMTCLGLAILRYRLWDIDVVIRRTLIYAVLTGALTAVYFTSVLALQAPIRALAGETPNQVVTVVSTLMIAALFFPLRRRVQALIDQRFYRHKYDSARTVAAFSAAVRDEVELDRLTGRLLDVVDETLQPEHVSLSLTVTALKSESGGTK
jgi:hypothetical protein